MFHIVSACLGPLTKRRFHLGVTLTPRLFRVPSDRFHVLCRWLVCFIAYLLSYKKHSIIATAASVCYYSIILGD